MLLMVLIVSCIRSTSCTRTFKTKYLDMLIVSRSCDLIFNITKEFGSELLTSILVLLLGKFTQMISTHRPKGQSEE
jgi:hypothetical protein